VHVSGATCPNLEQIILDGIEYGCSFCNCNVNVVVYGYFLHMVKLILDKKKKTIKFDEEERTTIPNQ
jgi:hypothetical protein